MSQTTELPEGWTRRRLRFDAELNPLKSKLDLPDDTEVSFVPMDAIGEYGGLRLDETRELDDVYSGYTYMADGDVSVAKITPCFENGKGALAQGLANGVGFGTTELHVIRPSNRLDERFLFYLTMAQDFRSLGEAEMIGAGGQKRVPTDFLKDWRPPMPPLDVQRRIARFLDDKTGQIDALVEKKRALLDRLAEKRQSLITSAVTKGLNPDEPMRHTGIAWLGSIPERWGDSRVSFVADVIDCKHRTPEYVSDGIPMVSTSEIKPYSIDYQTKRHVGQDEFDIMSEGGRRPLVGDIIYSRNASVGSAARVGRDQPLCLGQDLCLIRPKSIDSEYLEHYLNSLVCLGQLSQELVGATFKRVNVDVIKKYAIPLPSVREQEKIASRLSAALLKLSRVSDKVSASLVNLSEYRAALVTAAVTGQIEELR